MKFNEARLEAAIIELLGEQGFAHVRGADVFTNEVRESSKVIIKADLRAFLAKQYAHANITADEIDSVIRQLDSLPASDLYDSNKTFCQWLSDGFLLKREAAALPGASSEKDLYIQLIDYTGAALSQGQNQGTMVSIADSGRAVYQLANRPPQGDNNIYKMVNQLYIEGYNTAGEKSIPDGILYINGLPVVVFEFKSAIREEATIHDAYVQLTTRYRRDIPQLLVYNAFGVISDGVNTKMGSLFAPYEFFYPWRKVSGDESTEQYSINSLETLLQGLFNKKRLTEVIRHFIYFPDTSKEEIKIVCRYPQYYAATKLYRNIERNSKPQGDGKGGTYFGATGCGKSFTMLFLSRLLMKNVHFESPTIILITDRTNLDDQLAQQFTNAKTYIGDQTITTVQSRDHLRQLLKGRNSGGIFLTTIHKFTEDTQVLTQRHNVICISDEAHRSVINLDQKVTYHPTTQGETGVKRSYGFAKYLHDSLPNATYVGFTGTPIDGTLAVFGPVIDSYTMTESVKDGITVGIVYEGRAAKVLLDNQKLEDIEAYYQLCADEGSNEHQIEQSKRATININAILGDPDRIEVLAADFVKHYEQRVIEGATVKGKAMFVSSSREIAYQFYQQLAHLRPDWFTVLECEKSEELTEHARKKIKPMARVNMVMTRSNDDDKDLYQLLGSKEYRKTLDKQFKKARSNFKIAIVVDMWLTGFDVPFLDSIYIDKPVQKHNLIQTISRVNRKFEGKDKGLVIDYIGIKTQMNLALAQYAKSDGSNVEDINQSVIVVKDRLDSLGKLFHHFDSSAYFGGAPVAQYRCLSNAAEFALQTVTFERRFMALVKQLKAAYDVCCGSEQLSEIERDTLHFYLAVRSIVFKLTKGEAADAAQMNAKVRVMIAEALKSDGLEEIFKLGDEDGAIDIFNDDYLIKISKIKLPNTKAQLLQKLLEKAISDFKKTNQVQAINFSNRLRSLVERYNERKEQDVLHSDVIEDFSAQIVDLIGQLKAEIGSFEVMGINFEEKAFYDILLSLATKYDFNYPEDKLLALAKAIKVIVDDKAQYTDWNQRDDIKAELKVDLILLLAKHGYPPIDRDEVYKDIFQQAENFKKNRQRL